MCDAAILGTPPRLFLLMLVLPCDLWCWLLCSGLTLIQNEHALQNTATAAATNSKTQCRCWWDEWGAACTLHCLSVVVGVCTICCCGRAALATSAAAAAHPSAGISVLLPTVSLHGRVAILLPERRTVCARRKRACLRPAALPAQHLLGQEVQQVGPSRFGARGVAEAIAGIGTCAAVEEETRHLAVA